VGITKKCTGIGYYSCVYLSDSTNRKGCFNCVYRRGHLLTIKHLFKFLRASTSIDIGNNDEIDNDVKKNNINDGADKPDSE
jgi:hypothetical protein